MILIVGQTEDDILYFRSRFTGGEKTDSLPGGIRAYVGAFGNEDMVIAATGVGVLPAAIATSSLIDKYDPYLVVNVGTVISIAPNLHQGDIVLGERYYLKNVDFSLLTGDEYGAFPGGAPYLTFVKEVSNNARDAAYDVTSKYIARGYILSGDDVDVTKDVYEKIVKEHYASAKNLMVAYDSSSYGVAFAASSRKISLLTLRVVGVEAGKPDTLLSYKRATLESMSDIGSILAQLLIDKQNQFTTMQEDMD
ncbi:MAG: hypothetical protein MJ239_05900 [Bacilli bacterium]|nr:hypothetical protein [Bacilli bacterium]